MTKFESVPREAIYASRISVTAAFYFRLTNRTIKQLPHIHHKRRKLLPVTLNATGALQISLQYSQRFLAQLLLSCHTKNFHYKKLIPRQ